MLYLLYILSVQVNSGMYASFAQYIGAIVLDEEAIARALVDSLTAAAAASTVKKPTKKPSSALQGTGKGAGGGVGPHKNDMSGGDPILGKLLVMGNVTKKLVLIPDYPIGESVSRSASQHMSFCVRVCLFDFSLNTLNICTFVQRGCSLISHTRTHTYTHTHSLNLSSSNYSISLPPRESKEDRRIEC